MILRKNNYFCDNEPYRMKPYYVLFALLFFAAACHKEPAEVPEVDPPAESGPIEFAVYVKYKPLMQYITETDVYPVDVPFSESDRMVVTGEGISGTLTLDRGYSYTKGYVFTGYLDYEGPGEPPKDLVLEVRRVNASYSNDGKDLAEPAVAGTIEEAVYRYGCYKGECTFGNPFVELSLSSSFFQLFIYCTTSFPDSWDRKYHLINDGKSYGPFVLEGDGGYINPVLVFPEGTVLSGPMLDFDGVARFPVMPPPATVAGESVALEGGRYYLDEIWMHDLSKEAAYVTGRKVVIYQSGHQKPASSQIYVWDTIYPPLAPRTVCLSNVNVECDQVPMTLRVDTTLWVDGDCRIVSTDGGNPAISVEAPYSLHILGDGKLAAEVIGDGEGGAGISFGGYGYMDSCGDLTIEGSVSVQAKGASGAAGIGTGIIDAYYNPAPYCGDIIVNTKGTVKAEGGARAPGIGLGRIRKCEDPFIVSIGGILVSGGIVDATGGGEDACDIGIPEGVETSGGVTVSENVTCDGVHGYHVAKRKGDVPVGYDKSL